VNMDNREEIVERASNFWCTHGYYCGGENYPNIPEAMADFALEQLATYRTEVTAAIEKAEAQLVMLQWSSAYSHDYEKGYTNGHKAALASVRRHLGQGEKEIPKERIGTSAQEHVARCAHASAYQGLEGRTWFWFCHLCGTRLQAVESPELKEQPLLSLRRQLEIAEKALKDCRDAINKLPPDAFGTAGSSEGTNWYIRDELIGRADAALKEIEKHNP
jgi:hypothetical protein